MRYGNPVKVNNVWDGFRASRPSLEVFGTLSRHLSLIFGLSKISGFVHVHFKFLSSLKGLKHSADGRLHGVADRFIAVAGHLSVVVPSPVVVEPVPILVLY